MFTVTESAAAYLSEKLSEAQAPEEMGARFVLENQAVSIQIDRPGPGDTTYQHGERTVAVLDQEVAIQLAGMTLDVSETPEGPKLALIPGGEEGELEEEDESDGRRGRGLD
ncbi:MAG: hypothetical protein HYZ11_16340 [Candidatus Tectomicrobia bacterium]|uniref:Fe-S cluster assembly iron-binding protein IscA n=1 Tax=Tectimicrobiota bacterium TaxID=2528274 RepID=A0A932MQ11_UNCTE|nr:hypothetical protein [Candidatus Tectomicrobia bacterium]